MKRFAFLLLALMLPGMVLPMSAARAAAAAHPASALSIEQARDVLETLTDPARRKAFESTLNAIIKAQAAQTGKAEPGKGEVGKSDAGKAGSVAASGTAGGQPAGSAKVEGIPIPLAPNSLGAEVLLSAASFVSRVGAEASAALNTVQSLPLLYGWLVVMTTNPLAQHLLEDVSWRVVVVLICSVLVQVGFVRAMRRPIETLENLAPAVRTEDNVPAEAEGGAEAAVVIEPTGDPEARAEAGETEPPMAVRPRPSAWTLMKRVPLVLARLLLDLVPVVGLVLAGHLVAASSIGGQTISRLIVLAVVDAYAISAALLAVARLLLSPAAARLRLFHLSDAAARYMMAWTRRLVVIAVCGYAIGEVGLLLGLSSIAHEAMQKFIGLVLHLCLAYVVVVNRRAVRRWMRAPKEATGFAATARNRFAPVWHWVALFFLIVTWVAWAVEAPHGYVAVLHDVAVTALVLIAARLVILVVMGVVDRTMRPPEDSGMGPVMRARLQVYHPVVALIVRSGLYVVATLALLQMYGLGTFFWLIASPLGQRVLSGTGTLVVTIVLAFVVWETANAAFQQHLERLQRDAQTAKSARLRTLLPLLRTTLWVTIAIVAGLMVLSEIGINIGPLLAGAGIVGVAIGFGSQKLVQDLITGIFLLLENAMQVGDVVSVGSQAGVVESLSIRTVRLRSEDGSVHIIPFSSVTTVTNMTKDYSRAVIVVSVGYKEDYDRVVPVLREIVREMRADPAWKGIILDDLEVWGLDNFGESSVDIKCRIMCTPLGRWAVKREFNRRMKMRFDQLGIEIPYPYRQLVMDTMPLALPSGIRETTDETKRAAD